MHASVRGVDVGIPPVSYTHLDVYKRQIVHSIRVFKRSEGHDLPPGVNETDVYKRQSSTTA